MQRYVVVRDGVVENVVLWDGASDWHPDEDCEVMQSDTLEIGDEIG